MKRITIVSVALLATMAANAGVVNGTVVDEKGNPVEYATVVALRDKKQCAGTVTDSIGSYSMNVADGAYTFVFTSVGYKAAEKNETVKFAETYKKPKKIFEVLDETMYGLCLTFDDGSRYNADSIGSAMQELESFFYRLAEESD